MKTLVIIDGKSVFYRGYYAMGALSTAEGVPTGGVYGFAAIAIELVRRLHPDKVVVAWDAKGSADSRKKLYAEYKAGRKRPGEDFFTQIPLLQELVQALGWSFVECVDYEADDIIGTLSKQAETEGGWQTYIISSDLDMLQIVDQRTHMYRVLKGFSQLDKMDIVAIERKYGVKKQQFLDLKALKGDASDNIPGVPGVGEKTAAKLLQKYMNLDDIYAHLEELPEKTREKLEQGKELAYLSYELARIRHDAPVNLNDLPDLKLNPERLREILEKLEFRTLLRKFKLNQGVGGGESGRAGVTGGTVPRDWVIRKNVKVEMHKDAQLAEAILRGRKFWDVEQGDFLLHPLKRRRIDLSISDPEDEFLHQQTEYQKLPKLKQVLTELDFPMIPVLYKMEKRGMLISREYFVKLEQEYQQKLTELEQKIYQAAGEEFNINSPMQLSDILFDKLQLPTTGVKKLTKSYATGAKVLEKLQGRHPIIALLQQYRADAKLLNTYIVPLVKSADAEGYVHTTFTQNITATGRLSSLNPNLQNIPVRTEEGRRIRAGFVAAPGKVLVAADYAQFELRLAAVLAGDEQLIADFNAGVDIHTKTAAEVAGIPLEQVTKEQRRAAKTVNFGILYGMSARGLSEATGLSMQQAEQFIQDYFALRAPIRRYLDKILEQARTEGYVETYLGRRRPTPDVKSANYLVRSMAERAAQNMPIQGAEADLMKRAMIAIDQALPEGAELILQVHDSVMVECEQAQVAEVKKLLQEKMEQVAPELAIKLAVEVTSGPNWDALA